MEFVYLADHPEALPTVAEWYYHQWGKQHDITSLHMSMEMLKDYLNRDKIPLLILAKEEDEIIGAVQLKYYEMDIYPQKEHWVGGVFVDEKHRGKKIARQLVSRAVEVARAYNIDTLFLQTEKLNGGLYTKLGWKVIEKTVYRNKQVSVMRIDL